MDTIKLYITSARPNEMIDRIKLFCKNYTEIIGKNYKYHKGEYKNMRCVFNGTSLKIEGSISKFFQESNQYDVDIYDIEIIVKELSVIFDIDMSRAIVKRLDYAENIIVNNDVGRYINILSAGTTGKPFRISDETFYVEKFHKTVAAYNKTKELKKRKVFIHPDLIGKFVLRLEVRWKSIHKSLNLPELTFGMLTKHTILNKIKKMWAAEILSLNFNHSYLSNYSYSTPKLLEASMARQEMQRCGGLDMAIQELNRQKDLTAQQKHRLAKKLKELNNLSADNSSQTLAEELIEKVKIAAENPKPIYRMLPYTI